MLYIKGCHKLNSSCPLEDQGKGDNSTSTKKGLSCLGIEREGRVGSLVEGEKGFQV